MVEIWGLLLYDKGKRRGTKVSMVQVRNVTIGAGMPKICVPIVGTTKEEILTMARDICQVPADLVEWRGDWFDEIFDDQEVKNLLAELRPALGDMPLLFTFRTKAEGGEREVSAEKYAELNHLVVGTGCVDLIDVEIFSQEKVAGELIDEAHQWGVKVVGSNHDFKATPEKEEIIRRLCHIATVGADISKIAVMPQREEDVLTLLSATEEVRNRHIGKPVVTMSMSGKGVVSRISGETFGSAITFGALHKASAPGQIGVKELKGVLEILNQAQ